MESLYERLGGMEAVARIVFAFYDGVLQSHRLAPYFKGVDTRRLFDHQTRFLSSLIGGPPSFSDEQLRVAHAPLGIDDASFDEMLDLLEGTLIAFQVAEADRETILAEYRARHGVIVTSA